MIVHLRELCITAMASIGRMVKANTPIVPVLKWLLTDLVAFCTRIATRIGHTEKTTRSNTSHSPVCRILNQKYYIRDILLNIFPTIKSSSEWPTTIN